MQIFVQDLNLFNHLVATEVTIKRADPGLKSVIVKSTVLICEIKNLCIPSKRKIITIILLLRELVYKC